MEYVLINPYYISQTHYCHLSNLLNSCGNFSFFALLGRCEAQVLYMFSFSFFFFFWKINFGIHVSLSNTKTSDCETCFKKNKNTIESNVTIYCSITLRHWRIISHSFAFSHNCSLRFLWCEALPVAGKLVYCKVKRVSLQKKHNTFWKAKLCEIPGESVQEIRVSLNINLLPFFRQTLLCNSECLRDNPHTN